MPQPHSPIRLAIGQSIARRAIDNWRFVSLGFLASLLSQAATLQASSSRFLDLGVADIRSRIFIFCQSGDFRFRTRMDDFNNFVGRSVRLAKPDTPGWNPPDSSWSGHFGPNSKSIRRLADPGWFLSFELLNCAVRPAGKTCGNEAI